MCITLYIKYCRSVLDSLSYFTVAEGAMIPNVMHDLLEGVLRLEMRLMLQVYLHVYQLDIQG